MKVTSHAERPEPDNRTVIHDEDSTTRLAFTANATYAIVPTTVAEAFRDEGRREILKEISKCEEIRCSATYCEAECFFCGNPSIGGALIHEPSCLWFRAQAVKDAK